MVEKPDSGKSSQEFEERAAELSREKYILRLYITGATKTSLRAMENIKQICEEHLQGRYELEIIDVRENPGIAKTDQIVAIPTLIKKLPTPLRRFIGDLSDNERILIRMDLLEKQDLACE